MMTVEQRETALGAMSKAVQDHYQACIGIGNNSFTEFCCLMIEYVRMCEEAHLAGVDFSECGEHSLQCLTFRPKQLEYLKAKLDTIFTPEMLIKLKALD